MQLQPKSGLKKHIVCGTTGLTDIFTAALISFTGLHMANSHKLYLLTFFMLTLLLVAENKSEIRKETPK